MNMNVFDGFAHLRLSFYIFPSIYFHFKVTLEDSLVTNTTIENPMTGGTEIVVPQMSESRWDFKHFHQEKEGLVESVRYQLKSNDTLLQITRRTNLTKGIVGRWKFKRTSN